MSAAPMRLLLSWLESPVGPLAFACDEAGRARRSFGEGLIKAMRREYPGPGCRGTRARC